MPVMDPRVFCSGERPILNWPLRTPKMRKTYSSKEEQQLGFLCHFVNSWLVSEIQSCHLTCNLTST